MSREAAEIAKQSERPRSFGERRLRNACGDGSGASVLSGGHASMVASLSLRAYAEELVSKSTFICVSSS